MQLEIVRTLYNIHTERIEWLVSSDKIVNYYDTEETRFWLLWQVNDPLSDEWDGHKLVEVRTDIGIGIDTALELLSVAFDDVFMGSIKSGLFKRIKDLETREQFEHAEQHLLAGDAEGCFQHLLQFAVWAMQQIEASTGLATETELGAFWQCYGPSMLNGHKGLKYGDSGWEVVSLYA
jgi:hypothetical protein